MPQPSNPTHPAGLNRRQFLATTAFAAWPFHRIRAVDFAKPPAGTEQLSALLPVADRTVFIRWQNAPLTAYRAQTSQEYPYFYPLAGPLSGLSLTTESSLPYPHHRSLWLGCEPLNGGDYWNDAPLERGQVRSLELKLGTVTPQSAEFTDRCVWQRAGAPSPLRDERAFAVRVLNERVWVIDADLKLTANEEDAVVTKAKHSFFAIRAAADISPIYGGTLLNSEGGVGAAGTYGKPAKWCGFHGKRARRPEVVEGIALMNHPENFGADCPWFTRDYGHLSPSPFSFQKEPWRLAKGESLRLRYRVALHAGTPQEAGLDAIYDQWLHA